MPAGRTVITKFSRDRPCGTCAHAGPYLQCPGLLHNTGRTSLGWMSPNHHTIEQNLLHLGLANPVRNSCKDTLQGDTTFTPTLELRTHVQHEDPCLLLSLSQKHEVRYAKSWPKHFPHPPRSRANLFPFSHKSHSQGNAETPRLIQSLTV